MPAAVQQAFEAAVARQQQGDLAGAVAAYEKLLEIDPGHAGALGNLAAALRRSGRTQEALDCYRRAAADAAAPAAVWFNYGNLLTELQQPEEAERAFRRALEIDPELHPALSHLARLLDGLGRAEEAVALHRRAIAIEPRNAVSLRGLGKLLYEQGKLAEAEGLYRRALELTPDHVETMNALGVVLKDLRRSDEAMTLWRRVIERAPDYAPAHNNLGVMLRLLRRPAEAAAPLRRALDLDPQDNTTAANLAHVLLNLGQTTEAESVARDILARAPDSAEGHLMLGFTQAYQARVEEAMARFLEAHRLEPASSMAISNALFASLYSDGRDPRNLLELHRELAVRIAPADSPRLSWKNQRTADRPLKVGYLSPDLRRHPVSAFIEPVLAGHDRARVSVHCYSTTEAPDEVTARLQKHAAAWRDCRGCSDRQLVQQIEDDRIDILVDLAGHTAQNRAAVLRAKPAPVQALYVGYPGTSGLPEVDYLIADARVCPPEHDAFYSEHIARLPRSFWCFRPPEHAPAPAGPAFVRNTGITFGSYNALQKLSDAAVQLWTRILSSVPDSKLLLKSLSFADARLREITEQRFVKAGLSPGRVIAVPPTDPQQFYAEYRHLDIALDPIPYNGGTTTCEALWMGVPVVALNGDLFRGRMGAAILDIIGLPELAAQTPDDYVRLAVALAADRRRLSELHSTLREHMAASALCDGAGAARDLEALYRRMWKLGSDPEVSPRNLHW
jgi:protein O-GlcNAc transferase